MHSISGRFGEYLIGADEIPATHANVVDNRDVESALNVLRGCVHFPSSVALLRRLIDDHQVGHPSRHMGDVDVIDRASILVARGWLKVASPILPPLIRGGGVHKAEQAARVAAAPAAARRAATETDEPSFVPNVDQAALAATLKSASESGVPFCEECAKAAARAA